MNSRAIAVRWSLRLHAVEAKAGAFAYMPFGAVSSSPPPQSDQRRFFSSLDVREKHMRLKLLDGFESILRVRNYFHRCLGIGQHALYQSACFRVVIHGDNADAFQLLRQWWVFGIWTLMSFCGA